ncbi:hypothetical protein ACEQ8H_003039 [Pleosporales sp. CAS-2024a]
MRTIALLFLGLALQPGIASPYVVRRQDHAPPDHSQVPQSTLVRSQASTPLVAPQASSLSASTVAAHATSESSARPSSTSSGDVTTTSTAPSTSSRDQANPLPLHPRVTPAMGLTGALLLSGLVYGMIGIKNRWVYIFGSAAYLSALAVTVLIIYLTNPPVSDSMQGAFFVAAFFTGLIFGVLCLVFSDITEGLGCLLGGFCLSMWFLSLKCGGLINSSTGRAIFIGCMSAGGYSLSFSHYTRKYGLIASISFSGGTITMLGIDCLACAGWKEFWLFLWGLNDDIFPLNTNTYPVTKNIKAELAGVVIIAVFGIISQLRVWNLVKERREKIAVQELEKQEEQNREAEANAKIVEDRFRKEPAQWEASSGNQSIPDFSVKSASIASPKGLTSVRESERESEICGTDSMEIVNLKSGFKPQGTSVTVNVLKDEDIQPARADLPCPIPPPPLVVPLPFKVPTAEDAGHDHDTSSVSAVPESSDLSASPPISKRISDMSATRRSSMKEASRVDSGSSEALMDEVCVEEDGAISMAAMLDDEIEGVSVHQSSSPGSPIDTDAAAVKASGGHEETEMKAEDDTVQRRAFRQSLTTSTDPRWHGEGWKRSSRRDSRMRPDTVVADRLSVGEQSAHSQPGQAVSQMGSVYEAQMPTKLSKVAMSYRTNEWAKHLDRAEIPDLEDLSGPTLPNVVLEEVPEERAVPVSDEIAGPLVGNKRASRRTSLEPRMSGTGLDGSASTFSHAPSGVLSRSRSGAQQDGLAPLPSHAVMGQQEGLKRRHDLQTHQGLRPRGPSVEQQQQMNVASPRRSRPWMSQKWQKNSGECRGGPTGFDSHQPRRASSAQSDRKREEVFAGWRDHIREVSGGQTQGHAAMEQQRAAMVHERRSKEMAKARRESVRQQRASMVDSMMRSAHMLEAHREAMRKMQAKAKTDARLDLHLLTTTATHPTVTTALPRPPPPASAPAPSPPPPPLPPRWSLTNRIFNLNPLRSLYQQQQQQGPPRPPASRLWNPVNSSPRTLAVQHQHQHQHQHQQHYHQQHHHQQHHHSHSPSHSHSHQPPDPDPRPNLPIEPPATADRDEYPLLALPQRRQSRRSSLLVERSTADDSASARTSIATPRPRRSALQPPRAPSSASVTMAAADAATLRPSAADVEPGIPPATAHGPARVSLPGSQRTSMHSPDADDADDTASEFPWGPTHPCFPHPNPHVPLHSDLYHSTRIIRIKRDWMMAGDLAPTFANLYPEILDPLVSEDQFRSLVQKINDTLVDAFDPFTLRACLDAVMGVATFWLWDDVGLTGVKKKLAGLERWIEDWNRTVGAKEAVHIIPLRRTGYLTLDIQIPDPHLGPDTATRPNTQQDQRIDAIQPQRDQYLPYNLAPTLQVNSQPQAVGT